MHKTDLQMIGSLIFSICLGCFFEDDDDNNEVSPASEANVATRGVLGIEALVVTILTLVRMMPMTMKMMMTMTMIGMKT